MRLLLSIADEAEALCACESDTVVLCGHSRLQLLRRQLDSCQAEAERLSQVVQDTKQTEESLLSQINALQETNSQQQV